MVFNLLMRVSLFVQNKQNRTSFIGPLASKQQLYGRQSARSSHGDELECWGSARRAMLGVAKRAEHVWGAERQSLGVPCAPRAKPATQPLVPMAAPAGLWGTEWCPHGSVGSVLGRNSGISPAVSTQLLGDAAGPSALV